MDLASRGPGGGYDKLDIHRGSLLCCKRFDEHLPYAPDDDPGGTAHCMRRPLRGSCGGGLPWWVTDIGGLPPPPSP